MTALIVSETIACMYVHMYVCPAVAVDMVHMGMSAANTMCVYGLH